MNERTDKYVHTYKFGSVDDERALLPYAIRQTLIYHIYMLPKLSCMCRCINTYTVFNTNFGWHFLYITNYVCALLLIH